MCGIIAVVRRPSERTRPTPSEVLGLLDAVIEALAAPDVPFAPVVLASAAERVGAADVLLRGVPGVSALVRDRELFAAG